MAMVHYVGLDVSLKQTLKRLPPDVRFTPKSGHYSVPL